jgi:chaperone required for assembly of F1-ATPase
MAKKPAKRFYETVSYKEVNGVYIIFLDERALKTPGKKMFSVPSKALAQAVAKEWDDQTDKIIPTDMPLTRLLNVAIEQTPDNRASLFLEARRYAGTDLLCYRAPEPRLLAERQSEQWDSWVKWSASKGVDLKTTHTLLAIEQSEVALSAVENYAASLDDIRLSLFVHLIAVYGSVILAMAVMEGELKAGKAFDISRLDSLYQIELWGEDEEAAEIIAALKSETEALGKILEMI